MKTPCFIHEDVYMATTEGKGRGMFALRDLPAEAVLEISPVLVMDRQARQLLDQTLLHDYIFEWQPDGQDLCCMALGYVPVYNHSYASNCEYLMDYEADCMIIRTVREVAANEELTINYNGDWNDEKPVWFEVKE